MEKPEEKLLKDLYGLNPNILPPAFQFPRLPPGISNPLFRNNFNLQKEKMINDAEAMSSKLEDFRRLYQNYASGLIDMNSSGVVPPTHPFFSRKNTIENLQQENLKLEKENLELKKQLSELKKENKKSA